MFVCTASGLLLSACASNPRCHEAGIASEELRTIFVVRRDWHSGVAVRAADWPEVRWRLPQEFATAEFVEFGWGDERFYVADQETSGITLRAALWPTPSVIHVIGLDSIKAADAQTDEIVPVRISAAGLHALAAGIQREFDGNQPMLAGPQASWVPAPNRFYDARRAFFFPRMCNWWVAQRLADAGCPIWPWTVLTAHRMIRKAHGFSR